MLGNTLRCSIHDYIVEECLFRALRNLISVLIVARYHRVSSKFVQKKYTLRVSECTVCTDTKILDSDSISY